MSNRQHSSASTSSQSSGVAPGGAASSTATTVAPVSSIIGNVVTPALAAAAIAKSKSDYVQVDALVLLKILKQCQETGGGAEPAQGILTGMVQIQESANGPKRIEVTNCFGLPNINNLKGGVAEFDEGEWKKQKIN
jgi:hypothetical protein